MESTVIFFKLYALSEPLTLDESATKQEVLNAMDSIILKKAILMGRYEKGKGY